jgi:hypothetical protein
MRRDSEGGTTINSENNKPSDEVMKKIANVTQTENGTFKIKMNIENPKIKIQATNSKTATTTGKSRERPLPGVKPYVSSSKRNVLA